MNLYFPMQFRHILFSIVISCSFTGFANVDSAASKLPTTVRDGISYYQYQVKDGESLYGIAKQFGWDYDLLDSLNLGASDKLRKGYMLIYPAGELTDNQTDVATASTNPGKGKVSYELPADASPYEVAKLLNISTAQLYAQNPSARRGLKKGDVITVDYSALDAVDVSSTAPKKDVAETVAEKFKQSPEKESPVEKTSQPSSSEQAGKVIVEPENNPYSGVSKRNPLVGLDKDMLMEYTIQPGDNAAIVASNFNTTVRDIYFLNKGVSESWFPAGLVINLLPGSKEEDHHFVELKKRVKSGESFYKVKKEDTWESIAADNAISVAELHDANPGVAILKKGKKIVVPKIQDFTERGDVVFTDPRESTSEGRSEIYKEVTDFGKPERNTGNLYDIVVLTSKASSDLKRDRDFLRGFLLGIKDIETYGKKIGVQVVDVSDNRLASSYMQDVKSNRPDLIVATFEKYFPEDLVSYAEQNGCKLVNVFDAKSESYNGFDGMFQVLQPSAMMNEKIADNIFEMFKTRHFIFIDDNSAEADSYSALLKNRLKKAGIPFDSYNDASRLKNIEASGSAGYVIVSNANTANSINANLQGVEAFREAYPTIPISVIGRPTWIVYAEKMSTLMKNCDTYIPSRFFYDDKSFATRQFNDKFSASYNVEPVASLPPYGAMGYDVATYFLNSLLRNNGDFNKSVSVPDGVEITFDFQRESAHSGMVNKSLYWMRYSPEGIKGIRF